MNSLTDFRKDKDHFFANHPHSPLTKAQKRAFNGLGYFPEDPALRLEVDIDPIIPPETVQMQTSTGDIQEYRKFGRFQFAVEGVPAELTVYHNEHGFFLPFVDSLAGQETYPAGRYLEITYISNGRYLVDFNQAYNPYCAYNDQWSCPLTPFENRLKVPIRAGEKIFKKQPADNHLNDSSLHSAPLT